MGISKHISKGDLTVVEKENNKTKYSQAFTFTIKDGVDEIFSESETLKFREDQNPIDEIGDAQKRLQKKVQEFEAGYNAQGDSELEDDIDVALEALKSGITVTIT